MGAISRTITGLILGFSAIFFIVGGIVSEKSIDFISIIVGIFLLGLGIFIIFNKKEDEIEQIKKSK